MCLSFRRDFAPSITRQFWVLFLLKYSFCSSESKLELIRLSHRNSPTDLRQREREIYGYGKYGWISIAKRNKNWQFVDFRNKLLYYLKNILWWKWHQLNICLIDSNDSISYTNVLVCMYTFYIKKGLRNLRKCIISRGQQSRLILKYSNIHKFQLNNSFNKKVIFDIKS